MSPQEKKCIEFERLHKQDEAFLIPNPWDAGSAKILEGMGFKALATTSAGFAMTRGGLDGTVCLSEKLLHCTDLAKITSIPITVDFEDGYGDTPEQVAKNILRLAETGVAGCSIEDFNRDKQELYDETEAVERMAAAVEAVTSLNMPFQLTARCENFLHEVKDMDNTLQRLSAYSDAGAHVVYAPGLSEFEQVRLIADEIGKPQNVLGVFFRDLNLKDLEVAGAKRVSVGGALAWAQMQALYSASQEMLEKGTFGWLSELTEVGEIRKLLS